MERLEGLAAGEDDFRIYLALWIDFPRVRGWRSFGLLAMEIPIMNISLFR